MFSAPLLEFPELRNTFYVVSLCTWAFAPLVMKPHTFTTHVWKIIVNKYGKKGDFGPQSSRPTSSATYTYRNR